MSYESSQLEWLNGQRAEFYTLLSQRKWKEASKVIDIVGDAGYESAALYLHRKFNEAENEYYWEPVEEDMGHPFITPEEEAAPRPEPRSSMETFGVSDDTLESLRYSEENRA